MSNVIVHHGDSRDVLRTLADCSIDSIVTDPPYALISTLKRFGNSPRTEASMPTAGPYMRASRGFMGKKWDTGETAFSVEFWAEVMRVLKPGGHVVAASGTRTYHRLACAIEDAGFEIRDMVSWLYGSGFPKSHDVAKGIDKAQLNIIRGRAGRSGQSFGQEYERSPKGAAISPDAQEWEGWGTALKPACEPWVLARKPLAGTVAGNVLEHGTGALNIDATRIHAEDARGGEYTVKRLKPGAQLDKTGGNWRPEDGVEFVGNMKPGRWPANVVHDGSEEVEADFPSANGGHWSGQTPSYAGRQAGSTDGKRVAEEGSAARFFYSAKADAEDRLGSKHPTVKPVDLMQWLCRLVTPPGGVILDPFAGSGSTGIAALNEGFDCILVEREEKFVADINRRLAWARGEGKITALEIAQIDTPDAEAKASGFGLPLFGGEAA